jgi:UDPglucose--hexose-1-phosphate uridylyltransferase
LPEIRTDPIGGRRVIIADDRSDRPGAFNSVAERAPIDPAADPFLEGHESMTPPEVWALRPDGGPADSPGWLVRSVPNLYPVLTSGAESPRLDPEPDLFSGRAAEGAHEVIINSPEAVTSLADLAPGQLDAVVSAWRERIAAHSTAACRHLFVNEDRTAGASLPHSHAQLIALPFVPSQIAREREAFSAHAARTAGLNLLSQVLASEIRRRERIVAIDDEAVLLAPWASASAYQLMLVPRDGRARFEDDGPSCSAMLGRALALLKTRFSAPPPLNLWIRTAPDGAESWTWRIDILPRLAQPAGIELGVGLGVNPISPERVASELRDLDSQ